MKIMKNILLAILLVILQYTVSAQSLKDANDAYNEASKLYATDKAGTINLLEKALAICNAIGSQGDTIRQKIEGFMPGLYYDVANTAYKEGKYEEALVKLKKASEIATLYKDDSYNQRSIRLMANVNYFLATAAVKNNLLDTALHFYQASIDIEPKAMKWLNVGQIYLRKGNEDKMAESMDKALELAKKENDTVSGNKAFLICKQYFFTQANAQQGKNNSKTLYYLNKTLKYDPKFSDALYIKSLVCYKLAKYQESADAANAAIKDEPDSHKRGKMYFQLGFAYIGLRNGPEACAAFKKASEWKEFTEKANMNLRNLKCH